MLTSIMESGYNFQMIKKILRRIDHEKTEEHAVT